MLKLDLNLTEENGIRQGVAQIRDRLENAYERIAGSDDYQKNDNNLRLIQVCVVTVSALATGYVNAFAHQERLGRAGAGVLALLIMGFVEKFYFTLRHGLATTYKSGRQRLVATLCYRTIQATMILNAAVLCAWVAGAAMPGFLSFWYQWSIAVHFALALLGVSAVRDSDAVVENRMRELKAEAAPLDILSIRKAAASGNWLLLLAARLRGLLDGVALAKNLLRDSPARPGSGHDGIGDVGDPNDCPPPVGEQWAEDGEENGGQVGKDRWAGGRGAQVISLSAAHRKALPPVGSPITFEKSTPVAGAQGGTQWQAPGGQVAGEQAAEWLKAILPSASNGWWEVRPEGNVLAIKFRWRDPDRQTLSFPRVTEELFNALAEGGPDLAGKTIRAQIAERLLALSSNPARCGKAQDVARRLGIDLDGDCAVGANTRQAIKL
jgi:hypothetical protein